MFALPSTGVSYWKIFFSAFVVLGLGMAISVAPLTTVVMSSVEEDRIGTASGINNAAPRVAGMLAVAILGVVMVIAFRHTLDASLVRLDLAPDVLRQIQSSAIKLGAIDVPSGLNANTTAAVRAGISHAFGFAFRLIMLICACLALASAAVTVGMISSDRAIQA